MDKVSFYLLTDTHYVSKKNWTEGKPFTFRERSDQIALKATPEILDTFLEKILADRETDTVLFTGDNVDNGDRNSHAEFRERLERLTRAGKRVYVIPATHDYCGCGEDNNTFTSVRYTATGTEPIAAMHKGELLDYYYDYGPKQALSLHRASGSYTVQLCDGVRLIMIADNGNGGGYCGLYEDGVRWLETELKKARESGDDVLLATHHPVLPPWEVFRHVAEHELFGGYQALCELLCEENVRVVFTGHTHVQSIRKYTDAQGRWFLDIATIALANAAGKMRRVTVDAAAGTCDVMSIGTETISGADTGGLSSFDYLYPLNFPGIWEKLIPLAAHDFAGFLALAEGYLPTEKLQKHRPALQLAARKALKIRLSTAAKCGKVWQQLTPAQRQEAKRKRLTDAVYTILRHIYAGNAPFTPDTVEYITIDGLAGQADKAVRLFRIKPVQKLIPAGSSLREMVQDFLYNCRTGDDDTVSFLLK